MPEGLLWGLPVGKTELDGSSVLRYALEWFVHLRLMMLPSNTKYTIATDYNTNRAEARERIVDWALEKDVEWIFWMDVDTIPPANALMQLLGRQADIVGGLVVTKSLVPQPLIMKRGTSFSVRDWQPGDLVECDGMGFGCTLMRAEIFKKLEKPWFTEGKIATEPTVVHEWTEDLPLMYRAVDAGFKCYCDTSLPCTHVDWATGKRFYWDLQHNAPVMMEPDGKKRMFPTAEQRLAYQATRDEKEGK